MLNIAYTRYQLTTNKLVSEAIASEGILEGAGVFSTLENGIQVVSNGAPEETNVFSGIAFSQYRAQTASIKVEEFVAPANGGSVVLARTPVDGIAKVLVKIDGTKATVQAGAAAAAGQVQLVGNVLTFNAEDAGKKVYVCYKYNLTVAEIESIPFMGDGVPGAPVSAQTNTVSVAQNGEFYTDQFDASCDWAQDGLVIHLVEGGIFTTAEEGCAVNGVVCHVPTADVPFLGIELL